MVLMTPGMLRRDRDACHEALLGHPLAKRPCPANHVAFARGVEESPLLSHGAVATVAQQQTRYASLLRQDCDACQEACYAGVLRRDREVLHEALLGHPLAKRPCHADHAFLAHVAGETAALQIACPAQPVAVEPVSASGPPRAQRPPTPAPGHADGDGDGADSGGCGRGTGTKGGGCTAIVPFVAASERICGPPPVVPVPRPLPCASAVWSGAPGAQSPAPLPEASTQLLRDAGFYVLPEEWLRDLSSRLVVAKPELSERNLAALLFQQCASRAVQAPAQTQEADGEMDCS